MTSEDPLFGHNRYSTIELVSNTDDGFLLTAADTSVEGNIVAVKLLLGAGDDILNIRSITTEHPHIVRVLDIFSFKGMLGIAMDFADHGNLKSFMVSSGDRCLDETTSRFYFQQLILAVEYSHRRGFPVGDIKLENLLLKSSSEPGAVYPVLKLSNRLGIAVNLDPSQQSRPIGRIPDYTAPEVILQMDGDPMCSDVWSCGVVLYVMLCGRYPFTGTTFNNVPNMSPETLKDICRRIQRPEYVLPSTLSPGSCDVIRRCLVVNPENRVRIAEILNHQWFREALPGGAENMNATILEEE